MKFLSFTIVSSCLALAASLKQKSLFGSTSVDSGSTRNNATKQIAVLITGIEDGFTWANALDMFISPVTQQGYGVHFYINLVGSGRQNHADWVTTPGEKPSPVSLSSWKKAITGTPGVEVKVLEILDRNQEVPIPANAPIKLPQYSPAKTKVGRNLLRKFKSLEHLMQKVVEQESAGHFRYNFVMAAREDPTWLSPLNMRTFDKAPSQNTVFSKSCLSFGGLNDKVFVFGRAAAEKCLIGLYSQFWTNGLDAHHAEEYWKKYVASKGVQSVPVAPTELAAEQTMWQNGKPCHSSLYYCSSAYKKSAVMCSGQAINAFDPP